jgi:hypothetical protein
MTSEQSEMLERYRAGTLGEEEERKLFCSALEDDELLEAVENTALIDMATEAPANRRIVAQALQSQIDLERASARARRWRWVAACACAPAAVAIWFLLVGPPSPGTSRVSPAFDSPGPDVISTEAEKALLLPGRLRLAAHLDRPGSNPVYRVGDILTLTVTDNDAGNLYAVERGPARIMLFPNTLQGSSSVVKNDRIVVDPDGRGGVTVKGPPGSRLLRVVLLPPELKLSGAAFADLERRATVIDLPYTVVGQ